MFRIKEERGVKQTFEINKDTEKSNTYCFNEPKKHLGVFNGILTGDLPPEIYTCIWIKHLNYTIAAKHINKANKTKIYAKQS